MTMVRRNRLRSARPRAQFGIDGAITAAATLAAAGINALATKNAAQQQATAIQANARQQAEALRQQNENNNKLQEQSIAFTREQNELNRDLQKDVQMNLQLLSGKQNTNELREAAKIQVKCGGSMRKKLRNAGDYQSPSFLRGMNGNLPFTVTDGGSVIPVAITPEGYDLYEIVGNDHEHYHKAQGGKNKTGVGIKFAGSQTIEGEGNQNSNQGELMLVTPNDAKFISRHSIRGFNPAKAVMSGVHPLDAFAQQEILKQVYGISDDGKDNSSTPVRGIKPYGGITTLDITPDLSLDFIAPVATGIVAGTRNENQARNGRSIKKCGGRKKAEGGTTWPAWKRIYGQYFNTTPVTVNGQQTYNITPTKYNLESPSYNSNPQTTAPQGRNYNYTQRGNIYGSLWNTAGNLGGALITTLGNNSAARILTGGYNDAANILADAYGRLSTIDMSAIDRNNYRAAHAMAALQAPIVQTGAERAAAERTLQRNRRMIDRGTLSSADAQNRNARAEVDYNDRISQIESNADKIRQGIIQENMQRITQVANENANRDVQANRDYTKAYLNLLQYNNDIANERITGAAQARADALTRNAEAWSGTKQANANSWAGAVATSANSIGSSIATNNKMNHEEAMAMLGASDDAVLRYIYSNPGSNQSKNAAYSMWLRYKNSNDTKYKRIADDLARTYNFV